MVPAPAFTYSDAMAQAEQEKANLSRTRFQKRNARLARMADEKLARREARAQFQSAAALKPTDSTQTRVQAILKPHWRRCGNKRKHNHLRPCTKNLNAHWPLPMNVLIVL